jgi:hypothetical protein
MHRCQVKYETDFPRLSHYLTVLEPPEDMQFNEYLFLMLMFTTAFLLHTTMTHAAVMASAAAQMSTRLKVDRFFRQPNLQLKLFNL